MDQLRSDLEALISKLKDADEFRERLDTIISVYPFNEYEFIISTLLGADILNLDDYYELRDEYIARNLYLFLFEISAPRGFGESWAQGHLKELVPSLQKPTKKLDQTYSGQYDFLLDTPEGRVKIEVKASRAVDFDSNEPLYVKALASNSLKRFDMNFQQIKPRYCDVFIWIGVWRDKIRYWVIPSKVVENHRYYSIGQHRGNVGEGQLHINQDNVGEFEVYETTSLHLYQAILSAFEQQKQI